MLQLELSRSSLSSLASDSCSVKSVSSPCATQANKSLSGPQSVLSPHRFKLTNRCSKVLFPASCLVSPGNTPVSALVQVSGSTFLQGPGLSVFPGAFVLTDLCRARGRAVLELFCLDV